jgi:hypothetical protein
MAGLVDKIKEAERADDLNVQRWGPVAGARYRVTLSPDGIIFYGFDGRRSPIPDGDYVVSRLGTVENVRYWAGGRDLGWVPGFYGAELEGQEQAGLIHVDRFKWVLADPAAKTCPVCHRNVPEGLLMPSGVCVDCHTNPEWKNAAAAND